MDKDPSPNDELHVARAEATAGHVRSDDGELDVALASPLRPEGAGLTPEQILAAGYASCFLAAIGDREARDGSPSAGARVVATVELSRDDPGRYRVRVSLEVSADGLDGEALDQLVAEADQVWPYTTGDVRADITVTRST